MSIWDWFTSPPEWAFRLEQQGVTNDRLLRSIMASIDDVKKAFANYQSTVEKMIAENKADNQAAIDKALADDEIKDSAAFQTLVEEITTANDKLVPPPTPFEPSNNA